ncbi:hypothetical protein ACFW9F_01860 [Streptomyces sp. NPDC059506]|uniref:hypothetical protein n=1 Tax=Streptomyces sp. NPDC059506 TaxID=3347751 RepID=UPI003674CA3C
MLARLKAGAAQRAVPSWRTRPCGMLSPQELERRIAEGERLAAAVETDAATAETAARALVTRLDDEQATGRPTRGQHFATEAGHLLDQAQTRLATAREHLQAAFTAAGHAEERTRYLATLAETAGRGRLALRLADTSWKEHRELTRRLSAERAEHQAAEAAARRPPRSGGGLGAGHAEPVRRAPRRGRPAGARPG